MNGRRRWRALLALLVLALTGAGALFVAQRWRPAPLPALPDLGGADPAVVAAIEAARAKVSASPRAAGAWGQLGMVLAAHGYDAEAVPCFTEAERLDARDPRWPYFRGVALSPGAPGAGLPDMRRAVALWGGGGPLAPRLRLAEALQAQGHDEEAKALFEQVLTHDPGNASAHLGLARLAHGRNDWAATQDHLRHCLGDEHVKKAAHSLLAEGHQRRGRAAEAARERGLAANAPAPLEAVDPVLEELSRLRVGRQASLVRASKLLKQGQARAASALLLETVRDYPDSASAWLGLGRALVAQKDHRGAERALRRALELAPALVEAHFYLGVALFEQGRTREAAGPLRQAVKLRPGHALAQYNLGHCLRRQGNRAGAIQAFAEAVRFKPHFAQAHTNLGELLAQDGRTAEAREHLKDAAALAPEDPRPRELLEKYRP